MDIKRDIKDLPVGSFISVVSVFKDIGARPASSGFGRGGQGLREELIYLLISINFCFDNLC